MEALKKAVAVMQQKDKDEILTASLEH